MTPCNADNIAEFIESTNDLIALNCIIRLAQKRLEDIEDKDDHWEDQFSIY